MTIYNNIDTPHLTALATTALLAVALSAGAQETPANDTARAGAQLEEIIVTASKREETLTKVPLAVSALSQDALQSAGVTELKDLTSTVPNVGMRTASFANSIQVSIRGITNSDFNQTGNPAIATYIDGVYVSRTQGLAGALYDLERVEVLRGPQGTLYGRNATGGNINVITAQPQDSFAAAVNLSYGNHDDVQADGMLNLPVNDELVLRGAFVVHRSAGYFDTLGTTVQNYGKSDDYGGRLTALWTPSDNFEWRLSLEDFVSSGTPGLSFDTGPDGKPSDGLAVFDRPVPEFPEPFNEIENFMARSRMDWHLSDALSLAYIAGYQHLDVRARFAVTSGIFDGDRNNTADSDSHELNLSFDDGRWRNLLGATYFHLRNTNNDVYHLYELDLSLAQLRPPLGITDAWGAFDQATFSLTDRLALIAGVRYSSERQSYSGDSLAFCDVDTPFDALLEHFSGPGCTQSTQDPSSGKWSSTTWKAGVEYDVSDRTAGYLTVTRGFKSGGLNVGVNAVPTFDPEEVTNYELGVKTRALDNTLSLNTAVFYQDYSDLQVTQIVLTGEGQTGQITDNAAGAAIYGVEIEGQWLASDADRLAGFVSYTHATYTDYANAIDQITGTAYPSLEGNDLPHTPELSARLQYSHDFLLPNGGTLTPLAAYYWQSKTYLREFNFPIDEVDAYGKTTLNLTYLAPGEHWRVAAYADNLEDDTVRSNGYGVLGHYFSDYRPPRTFGIRVSYEH